MWAPSQVVDKHRKRAGVIWLLFLGMIGAYSVWILVRALHKRAKPSMNVQLQNERYPFPTVTLCFDVHADRTGFGCDTAEFDCAETAEGQMQGGLGFDLDSEMIMSPEFVTRNEVRDSCVDMWLSDVDETITDAGGLPPYMSLGMTWNTGANNSDTVGVSEISSSVFMYLTDPRVPDPLGGHNRSTFLGDIPYTRVPGGEAGYDFTRTSMMMEMVETIPLSDASTKKYFAGSITPTNYAVVDGLFSDPSSQDQGKWMLDLFQPDLSHTVRKEIDPLEWTELIGSVGGTWEIFLVIWGILFVATRDEPQLKGRSLRKSASRGAQGVRKGAISVSSSLERGFSGRASKSRDKRMSKEKPRRSEGRAVDHPENLPPWDSADAAAAAAAGISPGHQISSEMSFSPSPPRSRRTARRRGLGMRPSVSTAASTFDSSSDSSYDGTEREVSPPHRSRSWNVSNFFSAWAGGRSSRVRKSQSSSSSTMTASTDRTNSLGKVTTNDDATLSTILPR